MLAVVRYPYCLLILLVIGISGCGDSGEYATTPVSGIVTCQGKPVANATVSFTPLPDSSREPGHNGRPGYGITDKDGHFVVTTYEDNDGAIVGKHEVTVGLNVDEGSGRAPPFACKGAKKEVTVERGTKEYNLDF